MRFLGAAIICIVILYGIDVYCFDGRYLAILIGMVSDIRTKW
jgi:hypothetical protein